MTDKLLGLTPVVVGCVPDIRRMVEPELKVDELKAAESVEHGMRGPQPLLLMPSLDETYIGLVMDED